MKRYKLLKDVPYHKAGETLHINPKGDLVFDNTAKWSVLLSQFDLDNKEVLNEWVEEIPENPKTVYGLKDGDKFWYSDVTCDECYELPWAEMYTAERSFGLVSLTEEEAIKKLTWLKARKILKRDAKGFKPNWLNKAEDRFIVDYSLFCGAVTHGHLGHLNVANCKNAIGHEFYFASQSDAEASIKDHPNEWKTYLGVEE